MISIGIDPGVNDGIEGDDGTTHIAESLQLNIFQDSYIKKNNWKDHYVNMPEYNNKKMAEPHIVAKFKFRNEKDYNAFHELVKKYIYNGKKVFDGMQRKHEKQSWYPLLEKPSKYLYVDE